MPSRTEVPLCVGHDPRMFDSTDPVNHHRARRICARCPRVMACLDDALAISSELKNHHAQSGPDGTWAGLLWRSGRVVDPRHRQTWPGAGAA